MATVVEVIVDPDNGPGTDYTSLNAALAGEIRDLVALDEICLITCRCTGGTADTTNAVFGGAGWTSDATRYVKIWTNPAEGYRPPMIRGATGNYYRLNSRLYQDNTLTHIKLDGMWLRYANSGTGLSFFVANSDISISNCYIQGITGNEHGIAAANAGITMRIWNTIVDLGVAGRYAVHSSGTGTIVYARNVTTYNDSTDRAWYESGGGVIHAINCIARCATPGFPGVWDAAGGSRTYCASDDATADDIGGAGNRINQTFTFVDAAGGDFHLTSGDAGALGFGTDLTADSETPFTDDIDGDVRPSAWSIGADDIPAAAPSGGGGSLINSGLIGGYD